MKLFILSTTVLMITANVQAQTIEGTPDKITVRKEAHAYSAIVSYVYTNNASTGKKSYYIMEDKDGKDVKRSVDFSEDFDPMGHATAYYEDPMNEGVKVKIQKNSQKPFEYMVQILTENPGTASETHYILVKDKAWKEVKRKVTLVEEFDTYGKSFYFYKDAMKNGLKVRIKAEKAK
jgi:hypothetical protein